MSEPRGMRSAWTNLAIFAALIALGCGDDDGTAEAKYELRCADASDYDTSVEALAESWWRWTLEPVDPPYVTDDCVDGSSGDVWFLTGTTGGDPVTRNCTIPADTPLFAPPVNVVLIPCPEEEGCDIETDEDSMVSAVTSFLPDDPDDVEMTISVDGEELDDACAERANTGVFTFQHEDSEAVCLGEFPADICPDLDLSGDRTATTDGWWSLIAPLSPGEHTLRMFSEVNFPDGPFTIDVTYELEVEEP